MQKRLIVICFGFLYFICSASAQDVSDTLRVPLDSAESIFLRQNFQLLAQRYNIDAQKALIIQAKLWPNPNLSVANGPIWKLYNPEATFLNNSSLSASLAQVILLAGKRNKQVRIAEANAKLSEYQFYDLVRTLKYTLRSDFFRVYYLRRSSNVYSEEILALQRVVNAFVEQQRKGYIAEKEVVRIKAQLYSLQNEYNDLVSQILEIETELRLILQVRPNWFVDPLPDLMSISRLDPGKYPLAALLDSAYQNRTDLQIARMGTEIDKLNYNYQKALAVPDITLSFSYDQQGSYVNNFNAIGASIDLPFFNRNQGNIKSAKASIENSAALQKNTEATVEGNVHEALQKAINVDRIFRNIDPNFAQDFSRLQKEVLANYEKRNISILDFLDFYDSYKQNVLQANQVYYNRVNAFEEINFYTGTNFFN